MPSGSFHVASTGQTLTENGLVEVETIAEISSRLIVNRAAFKTDARVVDWVAAFRSAAHAAA